MNPRTIVISLGAHALLGAVLLAVDDAPRERIATVVEIFSPPDPEPAKPDPEPAKPEPEVKPEPEPAKPTVKPEPAKPRPARRRPRRAAASRAKPGAAPLFTGLVLGNADGPGLAVGITEDVARGPRAAGGGGGGAVDPNPAPIEPIAPTIARTATCDRIEKPTVLERSRLMHYPDEARAAGAEGRLVLRIHVDRAGRVERVEVTAPVHPAIEREAIAAVRRWRFEPATRCGRAVAGTYVVARRFELTD